MSRFGKPLEREPESRRELRYIQSPLSRVDMRHQALSYPTSLD